MLSVITVGRPEIDEAAGAPKTNVVGAGAATLNGAAAAMAVVDLESSCVDDDVDDDDDDISLDNDLWEVRAAATTNLAYQVPLSLSSRLMPLISCKSGSQRSDIKYQWCGRE